MCDHTNTVLNITGGYHFDPQEGPWDDIQEEVICIDCGQIVQTADVPETHPVLEPAF